MSNYITLDWLNLRSEPLVKAGNIISIMPPDTVVEKLENDSVSDWFKVKVIISRTEMLGFAAAQYLRETDDSFQEPEETLSSIPEAHLITSRVIMRGSIQGRAYPLNEPTLKKSNLPDLSTEDKKQAIHSKLDFLDVEHSVRYIPAGNSTFCNIYATDLAYCLGLYVPRVWWTNNALANIAKGKKVDAVYERTVTELNANALANWFESFGHVYKWKRMLSIAALQDAVNKGSLGIIVAQRIDLNRSGHIVAVIPETAMQQGKRFDNKVLSPLQSQAGVTNKKYTTGNNWWENPGKFRKFSFWVWGG
jgi:hypothetical protein